MEKEKLGVIMLMMTNGKYLENGKEVDYLEERNYDYILENLLR